MKRIFFVLTIILMIAGCGLRHHTQSPFLLTAKHPQKVTLLVPLHGPLAGSGQAIKNGFLTAYYYAVQHGQSDSSISIVDTSQGNIANLYKQAVENGAEFIVGPLTKQNVQKLIDWKSLSIPTLALNTVPDYTKFDIQNLYQFGLSSEDEATQMAVKAWHKHPGRAMIIAPNNSWGQNIAKILQDNWQNFGGTIAITLLYDNKGSLKKQISHTLNIDLSQNNAKNLQRILWRKYKFIPRCRQDIDVIVLIAPPKDARQIRPLLQFYFAGNIPVYSTSIIYSGIVRPNLDRDLNGITFCVMPWLLESPTKLPKILPILRNQILTVWPNSYKRYNRLYALGIDSYYLMLNLNRLLRSPAKGIAGASGTFYIDNYRHIYRQLDWARMINGKPYLIS
jgi:outer membrane PBP1 activator LpoA protein